MREVLMLLSFKQNLKMGKLVNALHQQADIFLFLSILTFILRPNGSDLFLLPLGIYLVLYLTNKTSINLRINKFVYLIWLSLGILFLSLTVLCPLLKTLHRSVATPPAGTLRLAGSRESKIGCKI